MMSMNCYGFRRDDCLLGTQVSVVEELLEGYRLESNAKVWRGLMACCDDHFTVVRSKVNNKT
jgi:hypothetical protein